MLSRDFIDDSLYNPNYGYFAKRVEIFDGAKGGSEGIPFGEMKNVRGFEEEVERRYAVEEGEGEGGRDARQVWHTPTELFKPHYANAIANYIVTTHTSRSTSPTTPLKIYEIGAGNGTLLSGILSYIRTNHPDLYTHTSYTTIEVSQRLGALQLQSASTSGHASHVRVLQHSALELPAEEGYEGECFVLGMEVLDNLSRDVVRYTVDDHRPLQGLVTIDSQNEFYETYTPQLDPLLNRYLATRSTLPWPLFKPSPISTLALRSPAWNRFKNALPFAANLSEREFAPTGMFRLFEVLKERFPRGNVVLTDFDQLPEAVKGSGGPVVQTRLEGKTVPCSTYLVAQGHFDIFFPTDFSLLAELYKAVMPSGTPKLKISTHAEFLGKWGMPGATRCKDGRDPMIEWYENVRFAVTEGS